MIKNEAHFNKTIKYERELIAQILADPSLYSDAVSENITPDKFISKPYQEMFGVIGMLYNSNIEITYPNLAKHINTEYYKHIHEIIEPKLITINPRYVIDCLKTGHKIAELSLKLVDISHRLTTHNLSKPLDDIKIEIQQLADDTTQDIKKNILPRPMTELVNEYIEDIESRLIGSEMVGISSGFPKLDNIMGGFQPGSLYILAARPGEGKTSLGLNFASTAVKYAKNVMFYSLEMTCGQLINRLAANASNISQSLIYRGDLTSEQQDQLVAGIRQINNDNFMIDDDPKQSFEQIISKAKIINEMKGLDFLVIDYLTLMRSSKKFESRRLEVEEFTFMLKNTAKSLNIPVLCLAQLNRHMDARRNKAPMLSDLKESGSIEQDADVVLFISKDQDNRFLTAAKNRHGPTGYINIDCDLATNSFWEKT